MTDSVAFGRPDKIRTRPRGPPRHDHRLAVRRYAGSFAVIVTASDERSAGP